MPLAVSQTWSLCKEFLLCEADRSLMKLQYDFQRLAHDPPATDNSPVNHLVSVSCPLSNLQPVINVPRRET